MVLLSNIYVKIFLYIQNLKTVSLQTLGVRIGASKSRVFNLHFHVFINLILMIKTKDESP